MLHVQHIQNIGIFIIINEDTKKVEEEVNKVYKGKAPLTFFKTP